MAELAEEAVARDDVRVVVLTGTGRRSRRRRHLRATDAHEHFDVTAMDRANRIIRAIVNLDKPVVAAVNGVAAGVGCSAALAADIVVAKESAAFLLAFARIGLMPDGGASATVAASIGRARAMRMGLLAEPLTGAGGVRRRAGHPPRRRRGLRRGGGQAGPPARGRPTAGLAATKQAINAATLTELNAALERERTGQTVLMRTADVAEGMRAFSERRSRSSAASELERRHHFSASARMTRRLRLVATPSAFSTSALVSRAWW